MFLRKFNIKIQSLFTLKIGFLIIFFLSHTASYSQEKKRVDILHATELTAAENIANNAQRLIGNVNLKHEDILIWCDSAYTYTGTTRVDAFGNVHINQGDTLHLYANKVLYNGDQSFARAIKNVRLENKNTTLYSDTLDYDLEASTGYYDDFGKIVDSTNTLTSKAGKYFIDEDLIHFYNNVEGNNDKFTLKSDTVYYYSETGLLFVKGPSTIRDSANTLYTENGWYNSKTGEAELIKKPIVFNDSQQLKADYIKYNEENGDGFAKGSVQLFDYENKIIVEGNSALYNELLETATFTDSAVLMLYSDADTLYLHADTLRTVPDTIDGEKLIKAFYDVRFFRTDIQGMCDSLVYFTKDSVVQLHYKPIIWSEIHQITADLIELKQILDAPDEMHLTNNSFIISEQDSGQFDQIKGKNMVGYIINSELNNIDVDGNGQTLYYAREDNEIIGLNRAESSKIGILFKQGKIFRIAFYKSPSGKLKPLIDLTAEEKKLDGFDWKDNLRPYSKNDIFKRGVQGEEVIEKNEIPENLKR